MLLQKGRWQSIFIPLLLTLSLLLGGCGSLIDDLDISNQSAYPTATTALESEEVADQQHPLTGFEEVADYIRTYGKLPSNYITKRDAQLLGWIPSEGNLHEVAPGMSIGGDIFGNREGLLPKAKDRVWYEADIHYVEGRRGSDRIVFSNDGLIYATTDHYNSFVNLTEEGSQMP